MYTLLCIEDRDENLLVIERISEMFNGTVLKAYTCEEGLLLAEEQQPNIILMDLGLPDMNGLVATRQLKSNPRTRHIPVVAVTGNTQVTVQECLDAGCSDHILKPFTLSKLMVVLHKHNL